MIVFSSPTTRSLEGNSYATEFTKDLLIDPATRGTSDVSHTVAAIASLSGKERAAKFKNDLKVPDACATYGTYEELVNDSNVEIVYVASPHSHHFQHTMLALNAGKHVVCEKPITVNAKQAKILYQTAKDKKLFLLDAVWTRYFPLSVQVRGLIQKGEIGEVLRVMADTSMGEDTDDLWKRQKRRKVNMDLAGGALLESMCSSLSITFPVKVGISNNCSRHLLSHVDISNLVPYTPSRPAKGARQSPVLHGQICRDRGRRKHNYADLVPHNYTE